MRPVCLMHIEPYVQYEDRKSNMTKHAAKERAYDIHLYIPKNNDNLSGTA